MDLLYLEDGSEGRRSTRRRPGECGGTAAGACQVVVTATSMSTPTGLASRPGAWGAPETPET